MTVVVTGGQPEEDLEVAAVAVAVTMKRGPDVGLAGKVWNGDGILFDKEDLRIYMYINQSKASGGTYNNNGSKF